MATRRLQSGAHWAPHIANIGLVIGTTALVVPLTVRSRTLKREFMVMYVVLLLAGVLLFDTALERLDGAILMLGFVGLMGLMCAIALSARRRDPMGAEYAQEIPSSMRNAAAIMWLGIGLLVLLLKRPHYRLGGGRDRTSPGRQRSGHWPDHYRCGYQPAGARRFDHQRA